MIQGEIEQLRNLIDDLHAAIEQEDTSAIYDTVSQVSALYGDAVPKLDDAFDIMKEQSGLVDREANVIYQLLKRYLMQIESHESAGARKQEEISVTTSQYEEQMYKVMAAVLKIPDANPKIIAERCSISLPELFSTLAVIDTEKLLSGLNVIRAGQDKAPVTVIFDHVQRTMKGMEFMKCYETEGVPHIQGKERPTVFISYNQASAGSFVDSLQECLKSCATVVRDKTSMGDWESFTSFMKSIRKQDFAVLVITPEYLRSMACMYEVSEFLKDENWHDKVMFAVIDQSVYSTPVTGFLSFWQKKQNELHEQAKKIEPQNMSLITADLNKVIAIQQCFNCFYGAVCDSNNPMPWDIIPAIIRRIKICANEDFAADLDNSAFAKDREEQIRKALE